MTTHVLPSGKPYGYQAGKPVPMIVQCRGCTMAGARKPAESTDDAVRRIMRQFNYNPDEFWGWTEVRGLAGDLKVRVKG